MTQEKSQLLLFRVLRKFFKKKKPSTKAKKKKFVLEKRQKFAIGVAILSCGLFFAESVLNGYGLLIACFLAVFSDLLLLWGIHEDLAENFSVQVFILPFLYSLSVGLFSFLTPARILARLVITILYAVGLYSVFLSENIFVVASIRTIALLHSARIVSLIIALIAYFFLASTAFSLRIGFLPTIGIIAIFSLLLTFHSLWTYTLESSLKTNILWVLIISLCLVQLAGMLWFWPTSAIVVALFLTSTWYIFVGLTHMWLEKRLFRSVLWEYVWVAVIGFFMLIGLTKW